MDVGAGFSFGFDQPKTEDDVLLSLDQLDFADLDQWFGDGAGNLGGLYFAENSNQSFQDDVLVDMTRACEKDVVATAYDQQHSNQSWTFSDDERSNLLGYFQNCTDSDLSGSDLLEKQPSPPQQITIEVFDNLYQKQPEDVAEDLSSTIPSSTTTTTTDESNLTTSSSSDLSELALCAEEQLAQFFASLKDYSFEDEKAIGQATLDKLVEPSKKQGLKREPEEWPQISPPVPKPNVKRIPKRALPREERVALDRQYLRKYRANLSDEKRAKLAQRNAEHVRRSRERMSAEKRSEMMERNRATKRKSRSRMTAEQKEKEAKRKRKLENV